MVSVSTTPANFRGHGVMEWPRNSQSKSCRESCDSVASSKTPKSSSELWWFRESLKQHLYMKWGGGLFHQLSPTPLSPATLKGCQNHQLPRLSIVCFRVPGPPCGWAGARKAKPSCSGHCSPSEEDLKSRRKLETTTQ